MLGWVDDVFPLLAYLCASGVAIRLLSIRIAAPRWRLSCWLFVVATWAYLISRLIWVGADVLGWTYAGWGIVLHRGLILVGAYALLGALLALLALMVQGGAFEETPAPKPEDHA
jgi:hypothetical protein